MDITRWSIPKSDWLLFFSWRWRSSIQSAKTRPVADSGSEHQLLIGKFSLKLKKVHKTTRPFRYDLNKISYDHSVKVTNRFKGLYLVDRVPEELWKRFIILYRRQWLKPSPRKKAWKNTKRLSEEALQISEERRNKRQWRKGKYTQNILWNAEFQRIRQHKSSAMNLKVRMLKVKFESNVNGVVEEIDDWKNFSITTIRETLDLQPEKFGKVKLINIT